MREKSERQSKSEEVVRERERESQREPRELERNLWSINFFFFKTLQNVVILLI